MDTMLNRADEGGEALLEEPNSVASDSTEQAVAAPEIEPVEVCEAQPEEVPQAHMVVETGDVPETEPAIEVEAEAAIEVEVVTEAEAIIEIEPEVVTEAPAAVGVEVVEAIQEKNAPAKKRQVLVTSNCQTSGVSLCLKALLPDTDVHILHSWSITPEAVAETRAAIASADIWVTIMRDPALFEMAEGKQVVQIPYLNFPALHPDICFVRDSNGAMVRCVGESDYHSLLALWSYKAGLTLEQARAMFRKEVYREIGYFDGWDSSIEGQRAIFANSELSFDDYIRPLMAKVPFMHTSNHPAGAAIAQLGKLIARKITGDESVMKAPLHYLVQDTLSYAVTWPVYPEIAEQYGIDGCYIWKFIHGTFFTSLDHFLTETYAHYDRFDVSGWVCDRLESVELQDKLKNLAGL